MKIIGTGVDIVDNNRFKKYDKNKRFYEKIYSATELKKIKLNKNNINFLAKRFAAKEALVKAIGTGFRNKISFKEITINKDHLGKPFISISIRLKKYLIKKFKTKKFNIFLSLSDEKKYSIAFVILAK